MILSSKTKMINVSNKHINLLETFEAIFLLFNIQSKLFTQKNYKL